MVHEEAKAQGSRPLLEPGSQLMMANYQGPEWPQLLHRAELRRPPGRDRELPPWRWGIVGRTQSHLSPISEEGCGMHTQGMGISGHSVVGGA